jgi:hypothetical protein
MIIIILSEVTNNNLKKKGDMIIMNHPFKFKVNDIVRLKTGDSHLYCVRGFHVEYNGIFPGEEWVYIVYELVRPFDGINVEAEEEDLILISRPPQNSSVHFAKLIVTPTPVEINKEIIRNDNTINEIMNVDALLDKFNDIRVLYEMFGDEKYVEDMERIKKQISYLAK